MTAWARRILGVACVAVVIAAAAPAVAQEKPPAISAAASRRSATIGDVIRLTVTVRAARGVEVEAPAFTDGRLGVFEIRDAGIERTQSFFGDPVTVAWYDITAFVVGEQVVPAVPVRYRAGGSDEWRVAYAPSVEISIRSVLPGGTIDDIRDVKAPLSYFEINWPAVIGAALVLGVCLGLAVWFVRRARRKPVALPHEIALDELEALKAFVRRSGEVKEFFVRISDCIRQYIEGSFGMKAPEMTTEEFLYRVRSSPVLSAAQKDLLKDFLKACDLVKFAKYRPTPAEIEHLLHAAEHFVEETMPANKEKP